MPLPYSRSWGKTDTFLKVVEKESQIVGQGYTFRLICQDQDRLFPEKPIGRFFLSEADMKGSGLLQISPEVLLTRAGLHLDVNENHQDLFPSGIPPGC